MVGMIMLNCNMEKYFVKMWSWGQFASWRWREPELHSHLAALVQAVSTNWYLTNTGLRYIHGITKFQLRPSLPQLHIVWYRSGKRSFPCHTSTLLLVLLLFPLSSFSSMLLLRFMMVFLLLLLLLRPLLLYLRFGLDILNELTPLLS